MALATQCPHCHTTFRVAHDQLKLRAGLVRCGACKQIFNGIENLVRTEEIRPSTAPAPSPASSSDNEIAPAAPGFGDLPLDEQTSPLTEESHESDADQAPAEKSRPEEPRSQEDPLLRMTLMDFAPARQQPPRETEEDSTPADDESADTVEQAIEDLQSKPWREELDAEARSEMDALDQVEAADYEEPAFVRQGRRRQKIGRILHIAMSVASAILFIGLVLQSVYVFRDQLAAWFPQTRPLLASACSFVGCQVGLPAQVDAVSIESSELQTLAASSNTFSLTALLRNRSTTAQAWPNIELTLNDADEKPLARRVFIPREYLPSGQDMNKGFAARSEQPLQIYFELSQLKAAGYRVYLFYP